MSTQRHLDDLFLNLAGGLSVAAAVASVPPNELPGRTEKASTGALSKRLQERNATLKVWRLENASRQISNRLKARIVTRIDRPFSPQGLILSGYRDKRGSAVRDAGARTEP